MSPLSPCRSPVPESATTTTCSDCTPRSEWPECCSTKLPERPLIRIRLEYEVRRGEELREAVLQASVQRLRPILMTTGAMVLGAVPLALATGAGAESRTQIGWVIVGDMSLGTLLAVFVVPTMYSLLARKSVPGPNKAVAHEAPSETVVH